MVIIGQELSLTILLALVLFLFNLSVGFVILLDYIYCLAVKHITPVYICIISKHLDFIEQCLTLFYSPISKTTLKPKIYETIILKTN